jgi:hypothetical protein
MFNILGSVCAVSWLTWPERLERCGPCWLLKQGKRGHKEYKLKGSFLSWLVGLVVPVQEIFVLPWLLWSDQYKIFFSSPYHTISIHLSPSPSMLAGSRAWSLVSLFVSLDMNVFAGFRSLTYVLLSTEELHSSTHPHALQHSLPKNPPLTRVRRSNCLQ